MSIYTPPTPIVDPASYRIGPNAVVVAFTPPTVPPAAPGGNFWLPSGSSQTFHPDQLDWAAGKMERLLLQDFSEKSEFKVADIDPVYAADGTTVLAAGFDIKLNQVNDLPSSWLIGTWSTDLATGWSFVEMIRSKLGIGTRYTPPSP